MPQTTPRNIAQTGRRVFVVSFPTAVAIPTAWSVGILPADRPYLVLMAFMLSLATAMVAATSWALALCHLSIARAFVAGMDAGRAHHGDGRRHRLHLVD